MTIMLSKTDRIIDGFSDLIVSTKIANYINNNYLNYYFIKQI